MCVLAGLLPWLAVAHCAFGLWMHTHFKVLTASQANALSGALRSTNSMLSDLALVPWSSTWERITQPNGLALLLLFVALSVWLLFGRCGPMYFWCPGTESRPPHCCNVSSRPVCHTLLLKHYPTMSP